MRKHWHAHTQAHKLTNTFTNKQTFTNITITSQTCTYTYVLGLTKTSLCIYNTKTKFVAQKYICTVAYIYILVHTPQFLRCLTRALHTICVIMCCSEEGMVIIVTHHPEVLMGRCSFEFLRCLMHTLKLHALCIFCSERNILIFTHLSDDARKDQ